MADETNREEIRKFLQERAEDATALVSGVPIAIVKDIQRVNAEITEEQQIPGTLGLIDETFTLGMIDDYLGKFEPIKGEKLIVYTIPLIFMVNTKNDDNYFELLKTTLDAFVVSLIGEFYSIQSNLGYATTCTEYTNTEQIFDINGGEYIKYLMTIFITKTTDIAVGNEIVYRIKKATEGSYTSILPLIRGAAKSFTPNFYQTLTENEAGAVPEKGIYDARLGFFLKKTDPLLKEFIKLVETQDYNNNVIYDLEKNYYDDPELLFERKFIILSCQINDELGTFVFILIDIAKPAKVLTS